MSKIAEIWRNLPSNDGPRDIQMAKCPKCLKKRHFAECPSYNIIMLPMMP